MLKGLAKTLLGTVQPFTTFNPCLEPEPETSLSDRWMLTPQLSLLRAEGSPAEEHPALGSGW
jgi:hypothetical protein